VTATTEDARSVFVTGLRNAHALETEAEQIIKRQLERLTDYPQMIEMLRAHLQDTERQKERLDQILGSMSESTSALKEGAMSIIGSLAALAHVPADDEVLKNTFANLAFENYEIAAYKSLLTMAKACGATNAQGLLQQSLQEEQRMAQWIDENVEDITRQYLARRSASH
jgi:ferritin-like metal-binding protein YciE